MLSRLAEAINRTSQDLFTGALCAQKCRLFALCLATGRPFVFQQK